METIVSETQFAPSERATPEILQKQAKLFDENEPLKKITDAISQMVVILNKQRQIIYANSLFLQFLDLKNSQSVTGKRPGEALNCIHSNQTPGGCGTTEFCSKCGAVNAILESQMGEQSVKECRILTHENEALDLKVTASPYYINDEMFTVFSISDTSNEKRRHILERVFFHDVLNSAGGISGLTSILQETGDNSEIADIAGMIHRAADNLIEEIQSQRQLSAAERGDLELNYSEINSKKLLREVAELYSNHQIISDKKIKIDEFAQSFQFNSDAVLLRKILGNMVKNALEASFPKSTVALTCSATEDKVKFTVNNENHMNRDIQLQVFNRSFSTKGSGRGIGTYSMKLFGEKYLKGKVGFTTDPEQGTTFYIEMPLKKSK